MAADSEASAAAVVDHNDADSNLVELTKEEIVSALRDPQMNEVGIYGLEQVGDQATGVNEEVMEIDLLSLISIYNELEDEVRGIFLLCGAYGKSILVNDLLKYVIGLGVFKNINSIDDARQELVKIIGKLKESSLVLDHDERDIQMHDHLGGFAKSIASDHVFAMERTVPLEDWPREDFLRGCSQIILEGNYIQKLPKRLDCPNLELLHLDSTGNRTLKIPDSFFEGMVNLQVLDLVGMVIQPELPTSLVSLTKLKTLCLNACSLGYMTGIAALTHLEILSFFESSIKEFPVETGQLTHLKMLDLSYFQIDDEVILPKILSNLTELEELYMGNLNDLEETCLDQLIIDSIKKLKVIIKVKKCDGLEYLFSVSKINKFFQLVEIEVSECRSMKNIVLLDSGTTIDEIESIPVRSLTLQHLPAINGFCSDGNFGSHDVPTLFPNEKALFRPLRHLKLISISRIMLLVITALSNGMAPLQNLETMEILDCDDLQYLFAIAKKEKKDHKAHENYGGLLPDLRQLHLRNLGKLRSIVGLNHPEGTLGFKMLNQLTIWSCNKLRYVLPLYVLENLQQLENIEISDCEMLERIFGDEDDTQMRKSDLIPHQLTKVKSLILEKLPKFSGCCQDGCMVEWLSLKKVRVVKCDMIQQGSLGMIERPLLTSVEVIECNTWANYEHPEINIIHLFRLTDELSRLEELKIKDSEELRKYMEMELEWSSFRKLKILEALQCDQELTKFLSTILLRRSHELEELTIENCKLLEQVFDLENLASDTLVTRIFPNLQTMRLNGLPKLNYICNNDPKIWGTLELGNLGKLEIINCSLKGPLPTTLVEKLVKLKIESCKMIEQVVEENVEMQGRLFCNLDDLQLLSLPKLTKFNSGHCNLTIPNLQSLRIEKCPELNAFTTGFLSNQITNEMMDACLKLQTLKLVGSKTFEEIWQDKVSNINITDCELKEVEVDSFSRLRYIFPSSMLPKLSEKLVTLVVRNCSSLSDVFQLMSENHSITAFQNLKIVRLKGCDSLQRLLLPCNYPSLTEIDISDCQSLEYIFMDTQINAEEKCFPNLESIVLENLPMLSSFSLEIFEFPKLHKARIVYCPAIETFLRKVLAKVSNFIDKDFSSKSPPFGHGKGRLLPQLEELELSDLPKMRLWNTEPQIPVFEKLTSLKIIGCGSIEKLFSVSVARHLVDLKSLTVYKCESMLHVLHGRGGRRLCRFEKLETLVLKHLPRLTCFCENGLALDFPELKMVRVEDVPNMSTFMPIFMLPLPFWTPKLNEVYVTYVNKYWRGDLNETIKYLHKDHEKLKKEVWKTDQSSPGNSLDRYKGAAESSLQVYADELIS
ncbi:hypothetical protein QN277_010631 [Acacia crassicarpa]|uniref:Disease resistance protein At4g27190-like leucine-rich repeats domain-containing protein n=1 Tax=Acacia crassicarpa TaxID=499986 RepID=A0AAE1IMZ9_9FABA|nr:hypothetical protein QN277_010631 [Acacia crassicarpa]